MTDWTYGYVADVDYTFGYYAELNPLRAVLPVRLVEVLPDTAAAPVAPLPAGPPAAASPKLTPELRAVVERLRSSESTSAIPIIILTSKSMTTADKQRLMGRINYMGEKAEFDSDAFVGLVRSLCPPVLG